MFFEIKKVNNDHSIDTLFAEANEKKEVENWCEKNFKPGSVYFVINKLELTSGPTGSSLDFFIPITEITKVEDKDEY